MGFVSWGVSSVTKCALSKLSEIKKIKTVNFSNKNVNPRENYLQSFFSHTNMTVGKALFMLGLGCVLLGRVLQTAARRSLDVRCAFFVAFLCSCVESGALSLL